MREYILCAALHWKDRLCHEEQPINIESGFVVCGRRHSDCYITSFILGDERELTGKMNEVNGGCVQGFITNTNKFLDRKEAYIVAKAAGQLLHDFHDKTNLILISEDLYGDEE